MSFRRPQELIRPEIRALSAYHVANADGMIKLDAMENPYGWPEALRTAWLDRLRGFALNRYPDPSPSALKRCLREFMAIPDSADLILGNGSDELILLIMLALLAPGRTVLAPEPSFVMYRMVAAFTGLNFVGVPLREGDFSLDMDAMLEAMGRCQPAVVFLASPNNPTGNRFGDRDIDQLIKSAPGLVVVDEAYFAFAEDNLLHRVLDYENLLIMRTLSKMGLAGLRLGLLIGDRGWLNEIDKLRLPYNINILTQASVEFALHHQSVLCQQCQHIRSDRDALLTGLQALPGITVFPSEANFLLFRAPPGQAPRLFTSLKEAGILIKDLSGAGGLLRDCLRVTVGTAEENHAFLATLAATL